MIASIGFCLILFGYLVKPEGKEDPDGTFVAGLIVGLGAALVVIYGHID